MTIREVMAMWLLYRACLTADKTNELRQAARRAKLYMPILAEFEDTPVRINKLKAARQEWPFRSHRTQAEVFRDEQQGI